MKGSVPRRRITPASSLIERCSFAVKGGDDPAAMLQPVGAQEAAAHRLQVSPLTPPETPHNCPLCPSNLCKVPFRLHPANIPAVSFTDWLSHRVIEQV